MDKICTKCKEEKPIEEFHKNKKSKDGHLTECKLCRNKLRKKYYQEKEKANTKRNKYKYKKKSKPLKPKQTLKEKRERQRKYRNKRYHNDPVYKLKRVMGASIRKAFEKNGFKRSIKSVEILGCSFEFLYNYLNNNKYGFKVGDPDLDIDHIIPINNIETEKRVLHLNHYINFQLLPSHYNRNIKKNKPFDKEHFEGWLEENKILGDKVA